MTSSEIASLLPLKPDVFEILLALADGDRHGYAILKTLEATGHNKTRAADILGISLKTLHNKLKKYRES